MRLTFVVLLFFLAGSLAAETLQVAVASNFLATARKLAEGFEAETGIKISLSNASTGKLYAQILHGAPYDVFMAADKERPILLEQQVKIVAGSRQTYAIGQLVFWSSNTTADCLAVLEQRDFTRLAIANPKIAPYGAAARDFLQSRKLWKALQNKLVRAENVGQTTAFLKAGAADAGFIAASQAIQLGDGCQWLVPVVNASILEQQLVILTSSNKQDIARDFVNYLNSDSAQQVISKNGYILP